MVPVLILTHYAKIRFGRVHSASARMRKANRSARSALQAPAHLALEAFLKWIAVVKHLGSAAPQSFTVGHLPDDVGKYNSQISLAL